MKLLFDAARPSESSLLALVFVVFLIPSFSFAAEPTEESLAQYLKKNLRKNSPVQSLNAITDTLDQIFGKDAHPSVADSTYRIKGYDVRLRDCEIMKASTDRLIIQFNFEIFDAKAKEAVSDSFKLSWIKTKDGKFTILGANLEVFPKFRGTSAPISRRVIEIQKLFLEKRFPATGRIKTVATSVGAYVWAIEGFKFSDDLQRINMRKDFDDFLQKKGIRLSTEELELFTEPYHFAAFTSGKSFVFPTASNDAIPLTDIQKKTGSLSGVYGELPLTKVEISTGTTRRVHGHIGKEFLLRANSSGWIG